MSIATVIDHKLFNELKKISKEHTINLFNLDGKFTEIVSTSINKFLIPIGLYSSSIPIKDPIINVTNNIINNYEYITLPTLYPLQKKVVTEVLTRMKKKISEKRSLYMTLHLACGFGKTITACYLMGIHKRKTIICVPNKMLINQWKSAVNNTNINYKISVDGVQKLLKELNKIPNVYDVLIIVSRHLSNDEFCKYIYANYDMFILDESHTYNLMNESIMSKFLTYYPPKICYFLTATPRRVNRIYCNDIVNVAKVSDLTKKINIVENFFEPYYTDVIRSLIKKLTPEYNKYHMYTEKILCEDKPRNDLIITTIIHAFEKHDINRVLVITKLRKHMLLIYNKLLEKFGNKYIFLGDAKNKNTQDIVKQVKTMERFIFISTAHYSGTGLDIPSLDSLIICLAVMNTMQMEQILGRICRDTELKNRIVYIFPNTSIREIKHSVGMYAQRLILLACDKLGFEKHTPIPFHSKVELALFKALNQ
ncbi:DNA helicase, transcript release factor [Eptesipox virus]|uniref:DNA helicase, transcript release factor n=1 Tax=Eptesipox virus TaxID=1329402 RepID=A0A220T6H8_9POXV|nr:DNA helicase, transcript release factor [Eptesipox virus]ASK51316.1 DNA helicase, transcript release factor [Eptesipox virus]WAH71074.1 DNA helicase, transcript release factor [Eptesipox virus]